MSKKIKKPLPPEVLAVSLPEKPPWARMFGESNLWYNRFWGFLLMGPRRNLLEAVNLEIVEENARREKEPGYEKKKKRRTVPRTWERYAIFFKWMERAEKWDENQRNQFERDWAQRRLEIRDTEFNIALAAFDKVKSMLQAPLYKITKKEDEEGKVTTVIEPADWNFTDALRIAEVASKLARLASELSQSQIDINVGSDTKPRSHSLENLRWLKEAAALPRPKIPMLDDDDGGEVIDGGSNGNGNGKH